MSNGPIYVVRHSASISVVETLIDLRTATAVPIKILEAWCSADTDETSLQLRVNVSRFATQGATGTALAEEIMSEGFTVSQATAFFNPGTDPAGTEKIIHRKGYNMIGDGFFYDFEKVLANVPGGDSAVLSLLDAPPAAVLLSFGMAYEELH